MITDMTRTLKIIPGEIGILPEYREVTGTPREVYGPSWALVEERRGGQGWAARPSPLVRIGQGEGAAPPFLLSLLFPPPESYSN